MTSFLVSVGLLFAVASANAATFTVTNTSDSGAGSLRQAVAEANAAANADTINFGVTGTIVLTSGQIQISGPLAIVGPGADKLAIDGNAASRIFSIFATDPACPALDGPNYLVSISGLRLTNARRTESNAGGAIFTEHSLALDAMVIDHNAAGNGGGVSFQILYPGQSLTINNSAFVNNRVRPLASATSVLGGAVAILERCSTRTAPVSVNISNGIFLGNLAQPVTLNGLGGAIFTDSQADIMITDTHVIGNGIEAPNPPVLTQSYRGGGIYGHAKSLTIVRSEVTENAATDVTSADVTRGGGLGVFNNAADLQAPGDAMVVKIINSTISGNESSATAGAMFVVANVAVELDNSTVTDNVVAPTRTGGILFTTAATNPPSAGNATAPTLKVVSSLLANNAGDAGDVSTNVSVIPSFTINAAHSLIEKICPSPNCEIAVAGSANLLAVDPMLGPLAFHGTTRAQPLLAGSPAIDAGSNPLGLTTDQRGPGFPRVIGAAADIGAFEYNPVSTGSAYSREYVQKAYVAYYGRPGDPAGQGYWALRMDAEGGSLNAIILAFGYSDEFNRRYSQLNNTQLVTKVYQQALNRDPDPAGLAFYVGELQAGRRTLQTITLDVLNGATTAPDSTIVSNKLDVAAYFTAKVAAGCPYGTEQDGVNSLSGVTADIVTVATAVVTINSRCGT